MNILNLERIIIDVTNYKISYIQAENGKIKTPVSILDLKNFNEQDLIIINAAISVIKEKSKESKDML
jgi:hypothetical protein